ncbi:MAG: FliA/WhiG family RNA polymerase sigma factor [Acidobacteriaceae bacterium]|nr:FliA/WhiG family RNA polymerase sigma factor [Acidobacteriaceae bacterium]
MIAAPYQTEARQIAPEERDRLILEHMKQVQLIARRIHETLPVNVCLDDLVSSGVVGLIMAIDNYDPTQAVKLKTYAEYKIRGAILDSLRGMDWASRHRRKKYKEIEAAISATERKLQRPPTEEEIAAELGITLAEYRERLVEVQGLTLGSLEMSVGPEQGQDLLSTIASSDESPSATVERTELERLIASAVEKLPEAEKLILALYYQEELTLREIGEIVNLRVSRVSELKTTSILRLRASVAANWPTPRGR